MLKSQPIPATAQSKAWVCNRSLATILDSNPAGDMDVWVLCLVWKKVSASGWSLVQRNPTECNVSDWVLRHCWRVGDLKSYVSASIIFLETLSGVQLIPY